MVPPLLHFIVAQFDLPLSWRGPFRASFPFCTRRFSRTSLDCGRNPNGQPWCVHILRATFYLFEREASENARGIEGLPPHSLQAKGFSTFFFLFDLFVEETQGQ